MRGCLRVVVRAAPQCAPRLHAARAPRDATDATHELSMRGNLLAMLALALLALALPGPARAARRLDQDFEFDDDVEGAARRPRRYVYDPNSPLCRALVCARREQCVLRDERTALCADRARLVRNGDVVVNAESEVAREDDVFYESSAAAPAPASTAADQRCVGCGSVPRAQFLCGSDNRTYSSLCRLDLHNCVRLPAPPVALACRGFCPCRHPRRAQDSSDRDEWHRVGRRRGRRPGARDVGPGPGPGLGPARRRDRPAPAPPSAAPDANGCAPDKMADRLLDWFSVLMDEAGESPPDRHGFPRDCKPETRWMFAHLDTDGDALLSSTELYALRHDSRERCLRPFLSGCGAGAGAGWVARAAWCGCLRRAARPCLALARAHAARARAPGGYAPACDARGYYRPRQCHAALGVCWCVDAHGQELPGSRGKGAPACPGEKLSANAISLSNETGEEAQEAQERARASERDGGGGGEGEGEGAPADDEDALAAGSGDAELRF